MPSVHSASYQHALFYVQRLKDLEDMYEMGGQRSLDAVSQFDLDKENIHKGHTWSTIQSEKNRYENLMVEYAVNGTYLKEFLISTQDQIHWLGAGMKAARYLGAQKDLAILFGNLGGMYHYAGGLRSAAKYYKEYLLLSQQIQYLAGEVNALCNLGIVYKDRGEFKTAVRFYEESLAKYERLASSPKVHCSILGNLGSAYLMLRQFKKAREYLNKALTIVEQINDLKAEAQVVSNLASVDLEEKKFSTAIEGYSRAIYLHEKLGNLLGKGIAFGNLGVTYARQNQFEQAIQYYEIALKIQKQLGNRRGEGPILNNLGAAYSAIGEIARALEYYSLRLQIATELDDPLGKITALENIGLAYSDLGDQQRSSEYHEQARELSHKLNQKKVRRRISFNQFLSR